MGLVGFDIDGGGSDCNLFGESDCFFTQLRLSLQLVPAHQRVSNHVRVVCAVGQGGYQAAVQQLDWLVYPAFYFYSVVSAEVENAWPKEMPVQCFFYYACPSSCVSNGCLAR